MSFPRKATHENEPHPIAQDANEPQERYPSKRYQVDGEADCSSLSRITQPRARVGLIRVAHVLVQSRLLWWA